MPIKPRKLTSNQQQVLDYLRVPDRGYVSPTEIGQKVRGYYASGGTGIPAGSSWASPICLRLVAKGLAERNEQGWYKAKEMSDADGKLPRLDQVMEAIERLRPGEEISFTAASAGGRLCHVGRHCTGFGPHDTEAARVALVEILEAHNTHLVTNYLDDDGNIVAGVEDFEGGA